MEDGTVSIFGLIFGVAATTSSSAAVLIAGASGAVSAAVSMMAGVFLDVETTRDEMKVKRAKLQASLSANAASVCAALPGELTAAGLTAQQSAALDRRGAERSRCAQWLAAGAARLARKAGQSVGAGAVDADCGFCRGGSSDPAVCFFTSRRRAWFPQA